MITLVFVHNKIPPPAGRPPTFRKPFELYLIRPTRQRTECPRNVAIRISHTQTFKRMLEAIARNSDCSEDALDEIRIHFTASLMTEGYTPYPVNCKYIRMADNTESYISFRLGFNHE